MDVSILVLLDDAYRRECSGLAVERELVSILVLLDDAYRLAHTGHTNFPTKKFQSLFFWMMPTGIKYSIGPYCNFGVSILVLLDDAYRPVVRK